MTFDEWWKQYIEQGGKSHFNIYANEESAKAAWNAALESACSRVQAELFPLDHPRGQHRYSTHFSEVRDAIMGDA